MPSCPLESVIEAMGQHLLLAQLLIKHCQIAKILECGEQFPTQPALLLPHG